MALEPLEIGVFISVEPDPVAQFAKVRDFGLRSCFIAGLPEPWGTSKADEFIQARDSQGITVTSMFSMYPDQVWDDIDLGKRVNGLVPEDRRANCIAINKRDADAAARVGIPRVVSHIGFVPEDDRRTHDAVRDAVREVCDYMGERSLVFALETGQEKPEVLRDFIEQVNRPNLRVNFDMANLILYGSGWPLPALDVLMDYVDGTHCKDGTWPTEPGRLGKEQPLGKGQVNVEAVIQRLYDGGYRGPLDIEREIEGEQQRLDIMEAIELLRGIRAGLGL
ncbi:MAG TPA: sugar phosphate isomerase/epimerase family protein [Armatimonadota bacterium]|nr:sugar phosphate isomerase/epimerase family protein [Armatimonadota bacterium]